jgi:hypothetical protein
MDLGAECEAYLTGRYVEALEEHSEAVPAWAWTNLLAHGTEEDLLAEAIADRTGTVASRRWRAARAYLAVELIEATDRGASLSGLQKDVLVPLELMLASRAEAGRWDHRHWVDVVLKELAQHRHTPN